MKPRISVVMSVRNDEAYVGDAVESVLGQSVSDFELLVVDDASEDSSGSILEGYAKCDTRIRLFRNKKRCGLARNLNTLLNVAEGRYIARMDSDDMSDPERLELQAMHLDVNSEIALVFTGARIMRPDGSYVCDYLEYPLQEKLRRLERTNYFLHATVMFRRAIIDAGYRYDETRAGCEDWYLWLRLAKDHTFAEIPRALYSYRYNAGSTTKAAYSAVRLASEALAWVLVCYFNGQRARAAQLAAESGVWVRGAERVCRALPSRAFVAVKELRYWLKRKVIHRF